MLDVKNAYSSKDAATWLDDLRDYLSGRTPELDQLFFWCEAQPAEIVKANEYGGFLDCAAPEVVSQQLWALLSGLLKGDASAKRTFSNVPRHNGFEAFRRLVEPVNEDKALVRKDFLSAVVHPKSALSMGNLQAEL